MYLATYQKICRKINLVGSSLQTHRHEIKPALPPKWLRSSAPPGTQKRLRFSGYQHKKNRYLIYTLRTLEPVAIASISRTRQAPCMKSPRTCTLYGYW